MTFMVVDRKRKLRSAQSMCVHVYVYVYEAKAACYICPKTFIKSCILSYKQSGSVLSVFYTNLTHLPNKQTGFFDKMCQ